MKPTARIALFVGFGLLALYPGYRIVAHTIADTAAMDDPERALRWIPDHPRALLALAERQLAAGDPSAAATTARHLIRVAPLEGGPQRVLARIDAAAGNTDRARTRFNRAVALGPRDMRARAWLADDLLVQGRYAEALDHIDRIMATSPHTRPALLGVLVRLSALPAFVDALTPVLPDARTGGKPTSANCSSRPNRTSPRWCWPRWPATTA
ncbi:tetratricopeptide repeat protein [Pseudoxanthomonas sp. NC8]|nr:tetratricopeptide repeat protein [Pseudoxanthomonas sp. NC8]